MRYLFIFIVHFLLIGPVSAQKTMNKQWSSEGLNVLQIRSDEVYNIKLYSHDEPEIRMSIYVEGESNESVVLEVKKRGDTLSLETAYSPYFEAYNDKLAAHKVIAIEMVVFVPSHIGVDLEARLASVDTYGPFNSLFVQLDQGNGIFNDFAGNGKLMARLGFIELWARDSVSGKAKSIFGKAINELPEGGQFQVEAESRHGNVTLKSSQ
ncbi:hypothetical protein [Aureitalea marina]|uniref:Uncharacterized protein n=1 Tax=Aureitalea marina TaxID=930804 RepID=A0A2S7KSJ6_9FLAO|nr:hypothetical protein [Aureitalea marina]PQB05601.1 hypothetical protein BST85_12360 [Aureitalea marina]